MPNNEESDVSNSDDDYEHYSTVAVLRIALDETEYIDTEKQNGEYVLCSLVINDDIMIDSCLSPKTFTTHNFKDVLEYMNDYSMFEDEPVIKKLDIVCYSEYGHIVKTPYLRIFQRKFKKYYSEKMKWIQRMKSPNALYARSIGTRFQ